MDELTLTGSTRVAEITTEGVNCYTVTPEQFGLKRCVLADLQGGDAAVNADIVLDVLGGAAGPQRDIVLLNSAFALTAAGLCDNPKAGIVRAAEAIDSGEALRRLQGLAQQTQKK
jgi:anthranilate phosphoribosyltransferase